MINFEQKAQKKDFMAKEKVFLKHELVIPINLDYIQFTIIYIRKILDTLQSFSVLFRAFV